jgi:hypothetical protein
MNEESLKCGCALCLQGCTHPLHQSERERQKEMMREKKRERDKERKRERERERDVEYIQNCYFLKE